MSHDTSEVVIIRDVWESNLEREMTQIRAVVEHYPFVSMVSNVMVSLVLLAYIFIVFQDTEFPGVVVKPQGSFSSQNDYAFKILVANVNILKLIQLGVSFFDAKGNTPPNVCSWQFNFKFNIKSDLFAQDSIDLLNRSGIQFARHESVLIFSLFTNPSFYPDVSLKSFLTSFVMYANRRALIRIILPSC